MDEYSALANKTRNLEQEYINQTFVAHTKEIAILRKSVAEYEEKEHQKEDIEGITGKLRKLEEENEDGKLEIKKLKKENIENIKQVKAHEDSLKEATNRIKELEEENNCLHTQADNEDKWKRQGKKNASVRNETVNSQGGVLSIEAISNLSDKQDQILHDIKELVSLREEYRARIDLLEAEIKAYKANEEKYSKNAHKLRGSEGKEDVAALRQRIIMLEKENNQHVRDAYAHEKTEKMVKEQKDSIALLQDSVSNKDKVIERLTAQVERLKKAKDHEGDVEQADIIKPQRSVVNDEEAVGRVPFNGVERLGKPTKKVAASKQRNAPPKLVSVEKLIKEDNSQFFNNLSFTNSSPMPDKKTKRKQ
ncbi:hypothetical protein PAEPH01_0355 [Pancytospora epiphaga]|nr:hypothetical protein PAEPH01_0355 [Pancytospora epiphaga]